MSDACGRLVLIADNENRVFVLQSGTATIGRTESNKIAVEDQRVSRTHLQLDCADEGVELTDLGSANGTLVNGERVTSHLLQDGDLVTIGSTGLRFEAPGRAPQTVAATQFVPQIAATIMSADPLELIVNDTSVPCVVVHEAGKTRRVDLIGESLVIGRDPDADVQLASVDASRVHARIERRGQSFFIRDLDSRWGTFVGDQRVNDERLRDGDTVRVGSARLGFKAGLAGPVLGVSASPPRKRRPVVVVPGLMGSELSRGSERVWPSVRTLLRKPEVFAQPDQTPLEPQGLVSDVVVVPGLIKLDQYRRLGNFLEESLGYERGNDLLEFAYDWRLDCRDSARRLAKAISAWRDSSPDAQEPITIVAHSLGCLVSRYYVERLGGRERVDRLILLGGPHYGTPQAVAMLATGPRLLPFGMLSGRLSEVLRTFPSFYQLLPAYPCTVDASGKPIDVLRDESWMSDAQRALAADARSFRAELGSRTRVPTVCIFGYGLDTLSQIRANVNEQGGWDRLDYTTDTNGDTAVPTESAVLEGADIHPVHQHHGSLYTDNDVKLRLTMELAQGVRPGAA
ncbi:MAG: FHA domain-containing protein [Gaiellaceae bacterium]